MSIKSYSIVLGLLVCAVLLSPLLIVTSVTAAAFEVWVSPTYGENTPGWGTTHFDRIQDAVDAAENGGIVNIGAGVYQENIVIDFDKSLSLQAEDFDNLPVIDGGGNFSGITLWGSDSLVKGLIIKNAQWGIWIESDNNTVSDCKISDCYVRMFILGTGNKVISNTFDGDGEGIMAGGDNNVVSNNTIIGSHPEGGGCTGIAFSYGSYNLIENNMIENFRAHIRLAGGENNIIADNNISKSWEPNYTTGKTPNSVKIRNAGVILYASHSNTVINNSISSISGGGIRMFGSSTGNIIQANKIRDIGHAGIGLYYGADHNEIVNNEISQANYGVILDDVNGNILLKNAFLDENPNAFDNGSNSWSQEGIGNYWRDFTGTTSYSISPNGTDNAPLLEPLSVTPAEKPVITFEPGEYAHIEAQYINTTESWDNENMVLQQFILIENGGKLNISNSTLDIIQDSGIIVEEGGELVLQGSELNIDTRNAVVIQVESGGRVEIVDSRLSGRGHSIRVERGG